MACPSRCDEPMNGRSCSPTRTVVGHPIRRAMSSTDRPATNTAGPRSVMARSSTCAAFDARWRSSHSLPHADSDQVAFGIGSALLQRIERRQRLVRRLRPDLPKRAGRVAPVWLIRPRVHQEERSDHIGSCGGDRDDDPAAERVPEEVDRLTDLPLEESHERRGQGVVVVAFRPRRRPMTELVDEHDPSPLEQGSNNRCEVFTRAGEAVHQHHRLPRPAGLVPCQAWLWLRRHPPATGW